MLKRTVIGAADLIAEALLSRQLRLRVGRHVWNRASGDNDADMDHNGEGALVERLREVLRGPAVVFDVGANVGDWSRLLAPGLDRSAAIYAFEPVAATYARLKERLAGLGDAPRIEPVHAALGEADGEAEIFVYGGGVSGANSLHRRDACALGTQIVGQQPVRCVRGDTFCAERGIDRIAFLKLDVEGHELAVLRGFASTLVGARIDALQFEYGGTWIDSRSYLKDAFELLLPLGYAIGKLFPDGIEWHDRYDYRLDTFQFANFVAARPEWKRQLVWS